MGKKNSSQKVFIQVAAWCFFFLTAVPAWAVQAHGGAEGLIAHQTGHILFLSGMIYLLVRIHQTNLNGPGWVEFISFLWFIIIWNLLAFTGHWLHEIVDTTKFVYENGHAYAASFTIASFTDLLFYISRLDHLVLVPAFIMLLRFLQIWRRLS
jgi:hypothetical protein